MRFLKKTCGQDLFKSREIFLSDASKNLQNIDNESITKMFTAIY